MQVCSYHHILLGNLDKRNATVQTHELLVSPVASDFAFLEAIVRLNFV